MTSWIARVITNACALAVAAWLFTGIAFNGKTTSNRFLTLLLVALIFGIILQPIYGAISDRIGRKWLLIAFGVSGVLFTIPLLTTLQAANGPFEAFLLIAAAWMIVSGYTSINAVVKAELFPTNIRAIGVGLPYALTVSIFGGTADSVALWLKSIGKISSASHAPFVGSVSPKFFGCDTMAEVGQLRDITGLFNTPRYSAWNELRDSEEAAYIGLTLPRYMARSPYNEYTNPADGINLTEAVRGDDESEFVWGSSALLFARNLVRSSPLGKVSIN